MIKEVRFFNWKSFREAKLLIDPLTVLIGTNASGKSNALDGLRFLNKIASGQDFQTALAGDISGHAIRGGSEWAALYPNKEFRLEVLIQSNENTDYLFSISISTDPRVELISESITRYKYKGKTTKNPYIINVYKTDDTNDGSPSITARLYNEHRGTPKECGRTFSILDQLKGQRLRQEITEAIECVRSNLQDIFVLDAVPGLMRSYSQFSSNLETDASNLAGVLAALPEEEQKKVEETICKYTVQLPEKDITRVWAEPVGIFKKDAMLYCKETWVEGEDAVTIDARSMSDGTLRFIAILVALLTRPEYSQIIIEEVDNGLHPARSKLLLRILQEIGMQRHIDILITTHNPALLDSLGPEMIPFVIIANRDTIDGTSELTLLEDVNNLPKLLASGTLGKITAQGKLEKGLHIRMVDGNA